MRCPLHVHIPDDKGRVLLFCLLEASILHGLALHCGGESLCFCLSRSMDGNMFIDLTPVDTCQRAGIASTDWTT